MRTWQHEDMSQKNFIQLSATHLECAHHVTQKAGKSTSSKSKNVISIRHLANPGLIPTSGYKEQHLFYLQNEYECTQTEL